MQTVPRTEDSPLTDSTIETVELPADVVERMKGVAASQHPGVHAAFALPHLVRGLLDRLLASEEALSGEAPPDTGDSAPVR